MPGTMVVAVLGLGEAGRVLADGLGETARVSGFDPVVAPQSARYATASSAAEAVADAGVIFALTAAPDAVSALGSVLGSARPGAVYVDFSSSSPHLKADLARTASEHGISFVDAVLMAPVTLAGLATPVLASGPGADRLADELAPHGMVIESLGGEAGAAATRKLLRSIVVKGVTALMVESLRTAEAYDQLDWFSEHVTETLTGLTPAVLGRLLDGTMQHSGRRVHEMQAAVEMVEGEGLSAAMTRGTVETLMSVGAVGIPRGSALR